MTARLDLFYFLLWTGNKRSGLMKTTMQQSDANRLITGESDAIDTVPKRFHSIEDIETVGVTVE